MSSPMPGLETSEVLRLVHPIYCLPPSATCCPCVPEGGIRAEHMLAASRMCGGYPNCSRTLLVIFGYVLFIIPHL